MKEEVNFHPMASMAGEFLDPEQRNRVSVLPASWVEDIPDLTPTEVRLIAAGIHRINGPRADQIACKLAQMYERDTHK
jgi:hypothetical protein